MGWQWVDEGDGAQPTAPQPDGQATQSMMNARAAGQQVNTVASANAWGQQQQAQMNAGPQAGVVNRMGAQQAQQGAGNASLMNDRAQAMGAANGMIGGHPAPMQQQAAPQPFANYANALGRRPGFNAGMQMQGAQLGQASATQGAGLQANNAAMQQERASFGAAKQLGQDGMIGGAPNQGAQANQQAMDEQRRKDMANRGVG